MTNSNTTFADLKTGTVLTYTDMSNPGIEYIVLDKFEDKFGKWVNLMGKETNHIAPRPARTEIGQRWEVIANN